MIVICQDKSSEYGGYNRCQIPKAPSAKHSMTALFEYFNA